MIDVTIAVPVIVALVAVAKTAGLASKFAPLLAILIGLVAFYFIGSGDIAANLFQGVIVGLSASGLYSGVKASAKMIQ